MADEFCLKMPDFHVTFRDLLHAANLRHATNGFTSLPKNGVLRIFSPWKNLTASAGFEPANLGTKGQHATSRPPQQLINHLQCTKWTKWKSSPSFLPLTSFYLITVDKQRYYCIWSHTHTHTVGLPWTRGSARRIDIYLTTHNTRKRQTSMPWGHSNPQSEQTSGRTPTP